MGRKMQKIDYTVDVIRTNRKKTAGISISGNFVKLYVPKEISEKKINAILDSKKSWIISKVKDERLVIPKFSKRYVSGEFFPYLGRNYRIKVEVGKENAVKLRQGNLNIFVLENEKNCDQSVKRILFEWYLGKAKTFLMKKTHLLSKEMGVMPRAVIIKDYKSKWGSCSFNGDIRYNWRIIMAPKKVVGYLVAHELCHLLEHNHSQNFWQQVSIYCSHLKESRDWLKKFGNNLIEL